MKTVLGALGIILAMAIATVLLLLAGVDQMIVTGMAMICLGMVLAWIALCRHAAEINARNHIRDIRFRAGVGYRRIAQHEGYGLHRAFRELRSFLNAQFRP